MQARMRGVTWHADLPSPALADLRVLDLFYFDFSGKQQRGQLISNVLWAEEVLRIFAKLWALRFPMRSLVPMAAFAGDDGLSMAANNSSCFNARRIKGTSRLSAHSYGAAIDINPVQNPVIRDGKVLPAEGAAFTDRDDLRPGMITEGSAVLEVFLAAGWSWGGHWQNPLDYHHLYRPEVSR